jgi:DNA-binding MarR family transcriptional regulator
MLDRSSNVSRLVEKLRLSDLAERVTHGKDRRMVVVTISEKGKKMLADIEQARFLEGADIVAAKLSEAELLELAHLLDKFRE